jgi:WD40 repeat protein
MLFEAAVMDVQFTQTVKFMGVFYRNSKLVIFNMEDSQAVPIKNIDFEFPLGRTSYSLAFSADSKFIAHVSSNANTVQVWEMKSLEPKWTVDLIGDTVTKVMFARNARDLLVLTTDAKLKYFRYHSEVGEVEPFREQYGVTDLEPTDCVISPNNKFIICAGVDGHIKVYDYLMRGSLIPAV